MQTSIEGGIGLMVSGRCFLGADIWVGIEGYAVPHLSLVSCKFEFTQNGLAGFRRDHRCMGKDKLRSQYPPGANAQQGGVCCHDDIIALKRELKDALILDGKTEFAITPHHVSEVDLTGAGDCFAERF